MAKTIKTRIFPDTTLTFVDLKQKSPVSDQALDKSDMRFQRKCPKTWLLSENDQIFKNGPDFLPEQKFSLIIFKQ